jgi:hypothetical protein
MWFWGVCPFGGTFFTFLPRRQNQRRIGCAAVPPLQKQVRFAGLPFGVQRNSLFRVCLFVSAPYASAGST